LAILDGQALVAFAVERDDLVVNAGKRPLAFLDQLWLKLTDAIPWNGDLHLAGFALDGLLRFTVARVARVLSRW
jgi:hypothetical protein